MENPQQILQHLTGLHSEISEMRADIGHLRDGQQRVESGMRVETQEIREFIRTEIRDLKTEQISDVRDHIKQLWEAVTDLRRRGDQSSGALGLLHWIFMGSGVVVGIIGAVMALKGLK